MNKKVFFISQKIGKGESGRIIRLLANCFSQENIEVTIYSFDENYEAYRMNKNIKKIRLKPKNKAFPLNKLEQIYLMRQIFKKNPNVTIVAFGHGMNIWTIIASLFLKNKVIVFEKNGMKSLNNRRRGILSRAILYQFSDLVVCQTPDAQRRFSKFLRKKTVVIPSTFDNYRRYTGIRKKEIVTFSHLELDKNLYMLINAFYSLQKEYPEYILSIYGDGSEKEKLITYLREVGMSDKVKIYSDTTKLYKKIYNCAMLVMCSYYEGIQSSIQKALRMGLPTIVSNASLSGTDINIESYKNGIIVPDGDTQEFYKAMKYIIDNPDKAVEMSQNAVYLKKDLLDIKSYKSWLNYI